MDTTAGGERYIAAAEPVFLGDGSALGELGANTRILSAGLMDGLLVRASGTVRWVDTDSFTIADGFFSAGAEVRTTVKTGAAPGVAVGDFVSIEGIASREGSRTILRVP